MPNLPDDTIVAIATPIGEGGIGIVRMSGKEALGIADRVFRSKDNSKSSEHKTFTIHYGWIADQEKIIDEVLLTVLRAPKTYTKEDIVEINCHGGILAVRKVLELLLRCGARLAEPGEFTKRAFLNNRIDLTQAEAVLDIIRSKTDRALTTATGQLRGSLSNRISELYDRLSDILAHIEAAVDFPEEDIQILTEENVLKRLREIEQSFVKLLETASAGVALRDGVRTVICGRPNVGKSSLMNAILMQERVIVTPIAGTTRDTVEEIVNIRGVPLRLTDTAGITEQAKGIEVEGVRRSREALDKAELALMVLDNNSPLTKEDEKIIEQLKGKQVLYIINKTDLPQKLILNGLTEKAIKISATKNLGIDALKEEIGNLIWKGDIERSSEPLVTNLRHKRAIEEARGAVNRAEEACAKNFSGEFIALDLQEALNSLGGIIGRDPSEDLLDKIFSQFCIGK